MSGVAGLKQRCMEAEEAAAYYKSLVDAFLTGDIPHNSTITHHIMGQWGRKRLEANKTQPSLLRSE